MIVGLVFLVVIHLIVGLFFGYIPINHAVEEATSAVSVTFSGAVILFGTILGLSVVSKKKKEPIKRLYIKLPPSLHGQCQTDEGTITITFED